MGLRNGKLAAMVYLIALSARGGMSTLDMPMWPASTVLVVNLFGFGVVGLVVCLQGHPALRPLRGRWLVKAGQLSYGLYMYHYVILLLSDDCCPAVRPGGRPFWRQALTVVAIFALAALSWRYIERPFLRLKDRFSYESIPPRTRAKPSSRRTSSTDRTPGCTRHEIGKPSPRDGPSIRLERRTWTFPLNTDCSLSCRAPTLVWSRPS